MRFPLDVKHPKLTEFSVIWKITGFNRNSYNCNTFTFCKHSPSILSILQTSHDIKLALSTDRFMAQGAWCLAGRRFAIRA